MTTLESVEQFLDQRQLALAGASRSGNKFGNSALKELTKKGYEITLIHPEADEIDGVKCYPSLADLPHEVGGLLLVVPPQQTEKIVPQAVEAGIQNIWMQQGSESMEAVKYCEDNDINVVYGECIMMFAEPEGFHNFHRWLWGLLGKLPKETS